MILFFAVWPFALLSHSRTRRVALLIASYLFYMWFSIPLVALLVFSSVLDFFVGKAIYFTEDKARRRGWLLVSLAGNLGVLFIFKYLNFFAGSLNSLCHLVTGNAPFPHFDILLPIGISFYTFQTLSYTIDIYRRKMEPTHSLLTFALYVGFFPQLVAGPIVRAAHLVPQLARGPEFIPGQLRRGLGWIVLGLLKKVVVADNLAPYANAVFELPNAYGGWDVLFGTYAFAFQIYCD
ncbi:MAG: MBOAT family protein, partial [Candidatus Omnitrophica bacterium]|nr:MBOAT family protein [Candidatus Omnitrophota bacterium]